MWFFKECYRYKLIYNGELVAIRFVDSKHNFTDIEISKVQEMERNKGENLSIGRYPELKVVKRLGTNLYATEDIVNELKLGILHKDRVSYGLQWYVWRDPRLEAMARGIRRDVLNKYRTIFKNTRMSVEHQEGVIIISFLYRRLSQDEISNALGLLNNWLMSVNNTGLQAQARLVNKGTTASNNIIVVKVQR